MKFRKAMMRKSCTSNIDHDDLRRNVLLLIMTIIKKIKISED